MAAGSDSAPIPMAAGSERRWRDDLEPGVRPLLRQRMVTKLVEMFKDDQSVNLEKFHLFAANVEECAFRIGQSKADYLRRISLKLLSVQQNYKRAQQASDENRKQQMHIAQQMQLGNPVQVIQRGSSLLSASSVTTRPVQPPSQQPNTIAADPNMQISPSNMMAVVNQNFNPQSATFAPMAPGAQFGQQIVQSIPMQSQNTRQAMQLQHTNFAQQIVQSIPMQSQNTRQAMQLQHTNFASYNPVSVAQLQGQPVVRPNHLLNQNVTDIYGIQQQSTQFIRNHQGYPGGLKSQQNVVCTAGLHSSLNASEQDVLKKEGLKKQINMESQLITPACGQVTVSEQGNVYCPILQTPEMTSPDQPVDWREKMFQQIQSWKAAYFSELMELDRTFVIPKRTKEHLQSLPKHKVEAYKRILHIKNMISGVLSFLSLPKSKISESCKEKLPSYEAAIHKLLDYHRKTKAHIKGSNVGKESQDRHGKPQTIVLTGGADLFNGGKSSHIQQNQSKQPADASIPQMRQNVVTKTPPAQKKTDSSNPEGVRSPCFSVKSPGRLQCSLNNDVGVCCTTSPISKSGVVELASPYGLLNSTLQSPVDKPGVMVADSPPCASVKSSSTSILDKSGILATASPCSSVESTLLSTVANSAVVPIASPCNLVKSTAPQDINMCHKVTPSELIVPASLDPAQTSASQTEGVAYDRADTPVAKKPIHRLIDAVRASSPAALHSAVNSMLSALIEMDSIPEPPPPWSNSDNKMKRDFNLTWSCSESLPPGSLDVAGAAAYYAERAAKRHKALVAGPEAPQHAGGPYGSILGRWESCIGA